MKEEQRLDQHDERLREQERNFVRLETKLDQLATKDDVRALHVAMAQLRVDVQKQVSDQSKWMVATVIGQFIGFAALIFAVRLA